MKKTEKCTCENFMFRLPNLKLLDKKIILSVKKKQKSKYVKK